MCKKMEVHFSQDGNHDRATGSMACNASSFTFKEAVLFTTCVIFLMCSLKEGSLSLYLPLHTPIFVFPFTDMYQASTDSIAGGNQCK